MNRATVRLWQGRLLTATCLAAILLAAAVLALAVLVPRLAGATPYTVLTGSMQPDYPPGTLVVVRPVAPTDVGVGDVLTYQRESGRSAVVTHRVVATAVSTTGGETTWTTRGDANPAPDPEPVRAVQVRGEVWYAVPLLGHLNAGLDAEQRQVATWAVGAALAAYAVVMLGGAVRDRAARSRVRA